MVLTLPVVEDTEILDFVAHIIYTCALLVCRLSGLAFYHRICNLHDEFLLAIKVLASLMVAGFLPQLFLLVFHCLPVTGLWPYDWQPDADKYKCLQWGLVYSVNSSVSLFCDFLLFGIPIAMLWILDLPRKRKVQLAAILLPGTLVVAISIARLILVIKGQWESDMSWSYNPMMAVEVSEIGATLIALSIPGIKPLFDRWVLRKTPHGSTAGNTSSGGGGGSRGTALRKLSLGRSNNGHSILENTVDIRTANKGSHEDHLDQSLSDDHDTHSHTRGSTEGIYVRVDFDMKEGRAASMNDGVGGGGAGGRPPHKNIMMGHGNGPF